MHDELDERVEFDSVEPVARGLAHYRDPVLETHGVEMRQPHLRGVAIVAEPRQPHDVGDLTGQPQHPSAVAADQHRHPLGGCGHQLSGLGVHAVMRPVHVDRLADSATVGIARLQTALFGLVLRGCIDPMAGGYYVARPRAGVCGPENKE